MMFGNFAELLRTCEIGKARNAGTERGKRAEWRDKRDGAEKRDCRLSAPSEV